MTLAEASQFSAPKHNHQGTRATTLTHAHSPAINQKPKVQEPHTLFQCKTVHLKLFILESGFKVLPWNPVRCGL